MKAGVSYRGGCLIQGTDVNSEDGVSYRGGFYTGN